MLPGQTSGTAYRYRGIEDILQMGNFRLRSGSTQKCTSIPNSFIEKYMPTAAGEFVKIYIYLLKCVNENQNELSISKIADVFNNTEKDTIRALKYWHRNGLLSLSFDGHELKSLTITLPNEGTCLPDENGTSEEITVSVETSARVTPPAAPENVCAAAEEGAAAPEGPAKLPEKPQFTCEELDAYSKEDDVPQLLYVIQKYIGTAISGSSLNTVMFLQKTLGFSPDLIEYLFDHCVSCGHKNMRYIEKTAINWAEKGIKTVEAAKAMNNVHDKAYAPVKEAFGIRGRSLADPETAYVDKWVISYGFSPELIREACSRTIKQIHDVSFEYADTILLNWKNAGIYTMDAVRLEDERFAAVKAAAAKKDEQAKASKTASNSKFNNFKQRSYDYTELEKKLLSN